MDAVVACGEVLIDDPNRFGDVEAIGMDETLGARTGRFGTQQWSTQIVDVAAGQLLDVVEARDSTKPAEWLAQRPVEWLGAIQWATLDLSGPYRQVFDTMLAHATQVADHFHVHKLTNTRLDECRRRIQNRKRRYSSPVMSRLRRNGRSGPASRRLLRPLSSTTRS